MKEKVLCAAIHFDDGLKYAHQPINIKSGLVFCGYRYPSIISTFQVINKNYKNRTVQGFLTDQNRFLNREEARKLVIETGQLKTTMRDDILYSEDLYCEDENIEIVKLNDNQLKQCNICGKTPFGVIHVVLSMANKFILVCDSCSKDKSIYNCMGGIIEEKVKYD